MMKIRISLLALSIIGFALMYQAVASDNSNQDSGSVCHLPLVRGPCAALMRRYGYDQSSHSCIQFYYTGCRGNANNFRSLEECQSVCPSERN